MESLIDGKWINIDSTFEYPVSINHPHYYEKNSSKKYKYILAFSHNSLEDVTFSYIQDWQIVLQRRIKDNKGRNRVEYKILFRTMNRIISIHYITKTLEK